MFAEITRDRAAFQFTSERLQVDPTLKTLSLIEDSQLRLKTAEAFLDQHIKSIDFTAPESDLSETSQSIRSRLIDSCQKGADSLLEYDTFAWIHNNEKALQYLQSHATATTPQQARSKKRKKKGKGKRPVSQARFFSTGAGSGSQTPNPATTARASSHGTAGPSGAGSATTTRMSPT